MDDPALDLIDDEPVDPVIAELRDVRGWRAEQRARYGTDWQDHDPPGCSEYERSRGLATTPQRV